jgi:D-lactate dehydrogenase
LFLQNLNFMSVRIAFFDAKPYDKETFNAVNQHFGFEIKFLKYHLSAETASLAAGYEIVCAFVNDDLSKPVIDQLYDSGVRLLALRSAGFNNVDFKAAFGKIHVVRVPAYSPHAIAEHTVALMLTLNRKIHRAYNRTREANFTLQGLLGFDFYGKTAGVIGTGKIGKELIEILLGFKMNVLAYDVYPDQKFAQEKGFLYTDLDNLYKESVVISLNCPLTKETEYLINEKSIRKMRDEVMIINTGRGKLIKTQDLIEGLKRGKVGSAGLDVYEEEGDYFFEDYSDLIMSDDVLARLLSFNNVIITSHQGFFTREALGNISETTLKNVNDFIEGKHLENEICYKCNLLGEPGCVKKLADPKRCF